MASAVITTPLAVAKSFCPGHITGLYERPPLQATDPLLVGSTGAGFSIERGISTSVQVYESRRKGYRISINGRQTRDAEVSRVVTERYLRLVSEELFISIDHTVGIPIGFGLGSSGAAALSLSYALNKALGSPLSNIEAAQLAHITEIECKTGLGTVIAESVGGFEMRLSPGAPGIGKIVSKTLDGYKAVILCISSLSTKSILGGVTPSETGLGTRLLSRLRQNTTAQEFMRLSSVFASHLGLHDGKCKAPINALARAGFASSVALFGETVFTLVPEADVANVKRVLGAFHGELFSCSVDSNGAMLL